MTLKNSIFARKKKDMKELALQDTALLVHIEHSKPIEINDLTKTLNAIGSLYSRFALKNGANEEIANAKLYVEKIKEGSIDIILTLVDIAPIIPIIADANVIMEFGKHIYDIFDYFMYGKGEKPKLDKKDCEDIYNTATITAKDRGSITNITVIDKRQITNTYYGNPMNFSNANTIQNQSKDACTETEQDIDFFSKVLMKLYQLQNTEKETKGNKAIISKITNKKLPIYFATDELKQQILFADENPFNKLFVVDVELQTIENIPKAYKITALYEILEDE